MNSIQVADETFLAAPDTLVGAVIADRSSWRRWWPDLQLQVIEDRAEKGVRWTVSGPLTGTMEIWLEPMLDGVLLHYFLHAEPAGITGRQLARLNLAKLIHRRRVAGKRMAFEVKARVEQSRPVGVAPLAGANELGK
ncbi:MAG: polyketide cyclase / dehydrase and lipid transport [Mycobacterium sp.]